MNNHTILQITVTIPLQLGNPKVFTLQTSHLMPLTLSMQLQFPVSSQSWSLDPSSEHSQSIYKVNYHYIEDLFWGVSAWLLTLTSGKVVMSRQAFVTFVSGCLVLTGTFTTIITWTINCSIFRTYAFWKA